MLRQRTPTALFLVFALTASLLAACRTGGGESTPASSRPPASSAAPPASSRPPASSAAPPASSRPPASSAAGWVYEEGGPVSPEKATVSVLTHSGHASTLAIPNKDLPVYAIIEERLGVTFDWQILENQTYHETVQVRLMSSDLPDMAVPIGKVEAQFSKLVEDGFFIPYDDLDMEANAPYTQKLFQDPDYAHLPDIYRSLYSDGKMYSFGCTVVPRMLFCNVILNKFWLDNLGLKEPETVDEFYEMLVAFRDNDPNGNGQKDEIPFIVTEWEGDIAFGGTFGFDAIRGWMPGGDGKVVNAFTTDNYRKYLEFRAKLYAEDLVDKEMRDMTANYELVAQDRTGGITYYATFQKTISGYSPYADEKVSFPVFQEILPMKNVNTGERTKYSRIMSGQGEGMYILSGAKNPEACLRIADWLWSSEEYEVLRTFGIEGDSYDIVDGKYVPKEPDGYSGAVSYLVSLGGGQPPFAYRQLELGWRNTYPEWMIERSDAMRPYYVDNEIPPFVFSAEENEQIARYSAEATTYKDEWKQNFITGRASFDQWQEYLDGYYSVGLTQLTEIHQANYDRNK